MPSTKDIAAVIQDVVVFNQRCVHRLERELKSYPTILSQPPKDPWKVILDHGNDYDEGLIKKWTDEMNNLLVIVSFLQTFILAF